MFSQYTEHYKLKLNTQNTDMIRKSTLILHITDIEYNDMMHLHRSLVAYVALRHLAPVYMLVLTSDHTVSQIWLRQWCCHFFLQLCACWWGSTHTKHCLSLCYFVWTSWAKTKLRNLDPEDSANTLLLDNVPVERMEELLYLGRKQTSDGYNYSRHST